MLPLGLYMVNKGFHFSIVNSDLPGFILCFHPKSGPAALRGLRASRHTHTHTHTQTRLQLCIRWTVHTEHARPLFEMEIRYRHFLKY